MKYVKLTGIVIILAVVLALALYGNSFSTHYNNSLVGFDYPQDWELVYEYSSENDSLAEAPDTPGNLSDALHTELRFEGPGIKSSTVKIYMLYPELFKSIKEELNAGFTSKSFDDYTYYEQLIDTKKDSRYVGILLREDMACTIIITGTRSEVNSGFRMMVDNFKFNN
jgi:hypothetical protein